MWLCNPNSLVLSGHRCCVHIKKKRGGTCAGQMWLLLLWFARLWSLKNHFKTSSLTRESMNGWIPPWADRTYDDFSLRRWLKAASTLLLCGPNHRPTRWFIHKCWALGSVMWCTPNLHTFAVSLISPSKHKDLHCAVLIHKLAKYASAGQSHKHRILAQHT